MRKLFRMKKLVLVAAIFMVAFVAFSILGFVNTSKAECQDGCDSYGVCRLCCPPGVCGGEDPGGKPINQPPVATLDKTTVPEDSDDNLIDVVAAATDPEEQAIYIFSWTLPTHGDFELRDNKFYYSPYDDYFGTDSFKYKLMDALGALSLETTLTVIVTPVNDAPVVNDIPSPLAVDEGSTFAPINLNAYVSDPDIGDEITWTYTEWPEFTVSIVSGEATIISKDVSYDTVRTITFTATDQEGAYDYDDADFTIIDVPTPPTVPEGIIQQPILVSEAQSCYCGIDYEFKGTLQVVSGISPLAFKAYYINWGDGTPFDDPIITTQSIEVNNAWHHWDNAGIYDVRIMAIIDDPDCDPSTNDGTQTLWCKPLPVIVKHSHEVPDDIVLGGIAES